MRNIRSWLPVLTLAGALVLGNTGLSAQEVQPPRHNLSTYPLGMVYGAYWAEYERVLTSHIGAAITASSLDWEGAKGGSAEVRARLYLTGRPMEKFFLSSGVGLSRGEGTTFDCRTMECVEQQESFVTPTFSVEIGYGWLFGEKHRFTVAPRVGAMRLINPPSTMRGEGDLAVVPTAQLSIGYAF